VCSSLKQRKKGKKMKNILIFDDSKRQIQAAREQFEDLEGFTLTVVSSYDEAQKFLKGAKFEIFLTDLLVPAPDNNLGPRGFKYVGEIMPLGAILALVALKNGVPLVGVVTDSNHHDHPASSALDALGGYWGEVHPIGESLLLSASNLLTRNGSSDGELVKDWKKAAERLLNGGEECEDEEDDDCEW